MKEIASDIIKKTVEEINWGRLIGIAAVVILIAAICWILVRLNKFTFRKMNEKRPGLHLVFFEHVITAIIVIVSIMLAVSTLNGIDSVVNTLLGGTAVISAVLAFAAQDVIKDVLAGLMISIHKPFEIGDRIVLEDGTAGIVESITMRHIVLIGLDSVREVIPNSKINTMQMSNYSVGTAGRSAKLTFSISYDSDVELAKKVIAQAIEESKYTVAGKRVQGGKFAYGPVYFISFADSALIMAVTVYYKKGVTTETVLDDVNTRVRKALSENGIEIPYNYITVVNKKD